MGTFLLEFPHLLHPTVSGSIGGSFSEEFDSPSVDSRTAWDFTPNFSYSSVSSSETVWFAALIQWNEADNASVYFSDVQTTLGTGSDVDDDAGFFVSSLGLHIDSSGNVSVGFWTNDANGNDFTLVDTNADATDDATHLLVARATKGSGSSPTNSSIDFWLDPTLAELSGTPDYQSGAISKWGRDSESLTALYVTSGTRNHVDEIRVGTSLSDLSFVPEPSSLALVGLSTLLILRRRRCR